MLIAINKGINFITVECDGTIWGSRYKEAKPGYYSLLGKLNKTLILPKDIAVIARIENNPMFLDENLQFQTIDGEPYEKLILREIISSQQFKEKDFT